MLEGSKFQHSDPLSIVSKVGIKLLGQLKKIKIIKIDEKGKRYKKIKKDKKVKKDKTNICFKN